MTRRTRLQTALAMRRRHVHYRPLPMARIMAAARARHLRRMERGQCSREHRRQWLCARAYHAAHHARLRVTCLTAAEVHTTLAPAWACLASLRDGVATEDQHTVLATHLAIAMAIEDSGIVRGMREHFDSAMAALAAIRARALASGAWLPQQLEFHEIDALAEAVDLHRHQLAYVSSGELRDITAKLIARTRSTGGKVVRTTAQNLGLVAA